MSAFADPVSGCPVCGWPGSEPYDVLSRHVTSEGLVTYSRCPCGEVRLLLRPYGAGETRRGGRR